jgi:hypothetical protein
MSKKVQHTFSVLLVLALLVSLLSTTAVAAGTETFTDVSADDSNYSAIMSLYELGYMVGTGNHKFSPNTNMTRGMAVTVLYRMAGSPAVTGTADFSDFKSGQYYSDAIVWAYQKGIVNGYTDGTVKADALITVTEGNIIISRYADKILGKTVGGSLTDPNATASTGMGMGIGMGMGNNTTATKSTTPAYVTRGDYAVAIENLIISTSEHSLDLTTYSSQWKYVAGGFELMGSNRGTPVSTGVFADTGYYALEDVIYVTNPTITSGKAVQILSIYVPEEYMKENADGTYSIDTKATKTVTYHDENGNETATYTWTAETAPIVMPNTVDGYAASSNVDINTAKANIFYFNYILSGFVVVTVQNRGINDSADDAGNIVGNAPSGLVDLKAAVAFIKANDSVLAGSSEKIFTQGASAGGAMSALLGATGDAKEYDSYLEELGAADASNSIYGAQVYCPITDLDNADAAYEWLHAYQLYNPGNWGASSTDFTEYDIALHNALMEVYEEYLESLGFDVTEYRDALTQELIDALNHAVVSGGHTDSTPIDPSDVIDTIIGSELSDETSSLVEYLKANNIDLDKALTWNAEKNTFEIASFDVFDLGSTFARLKSEPSFDYATESKLFGENGTEDEAKTQRHFSASYLAALEKLMESDDEEIAAQAKKTYDEIYEESTSVVASGVTNLMNPMYFLTGNSSSTVAKYWRFANGTTDSDQGTTAAWIMYNELNKLGDYTTEFNFIYGAPHGAADYLTGNGSGYYIANNLMTWIAQAANGDAVSD